MLFTCLTTRAVHIEVIEDLSSSSFMNSLRRFIAIRGKVQTFRSDRGTSFVEATDILKVVNVEKVLLRIYCTITDVHGSLIPLIPPTREECGKERSG